MQPIMTSLRIVPPDPVVAPTEPVDLTTTKQYCRIYVDFEDSLVSSLITTARIMAEEYLCRALVPQTYEWVMKPLAVNNTFFQSTVNFGFWAGANPLSHTTLEIPRAPVTAINTVSVLDAHADVVELGSDAYAIDNNLEPGRLCIYWNEVNAMDTPPQYPLQHIVVNFDAGYDGDVPTPIKQAIMMAVNYWYERRGDEMDMPEMPKAVYYLLDQYRITFFGSGI